MPLMTDVTNTNPPLLTYAINTNPYPLHAPLQASPIPPQGGKQEWNIGSLTLVATNNTNSDVPLTFLTLQIPVGPDAAELTDDTSYSSIVAVHDTTWTADTDNPHLTKDSNENVTAVRYHFKPNDGFNTLKANDSITFYFNGIKVNGVAGTVDLLVTEGSSGPPTQQIPVTKFPAGWGWVSFIASPEIIKGNEGGNNTASLTWDGPAGATYDIEYINAGDIVKIPVEGDKPLSNSDKHPSEPLTQTTTFYLNVTYTASDNITYKAQLEQVVTVSIKPVINWFTGEIRAGNLGLELQVSWSTSGAVNISISDSPSSLLTSAGTKTLDYSAGNPLASTYILTASNAAGSVTHQINLIWDQVTSVPCGTYASGVAVSPKGDYVYVVCIEAREANQEVWTYSIGSLENYGPTVLTGVSLGGCDVSGITVSEHGRYICVASSGSNNVSLLSTNGPQVLSNSKPTPVGKSPLAITMTRDLGLIYTANEGDCNVTVITSSNQQLPGSPVTVGSNPNDIILSPDESTLYVSNAFSDNVTVLNAKTLQQTALIPVGQGPVSMAITANGATLFVANSNGSTSYGTISVIDTHTNTVTGSPITIGNGMKKIALSKDCALLYSASWPGGFVTVIDTSTLQPIRSIPLIGCTPCGIAISPDNSRIFVPSAVGNLLYVISPSVPL